MLARLCVALGSGTWQRDSQGMYSGHTGFSLAEEGLAADVEVQEISCREHLVCEMVMHE